ncbi:hypothetical protein AJ79_06828 [Helicocarpus griseus UAMH5409]|uniref:Methyltransferase type 11 domain-containing protein n=1 Tax=Helicocarpus griseus UAMH5409 TaxID=1447875 RepID=A0A2B7X8Y9_9EURO|nr:hypothetical protein AJ79_06828 [Helicocarpus griseus UAMH5409]
MAAAKAEEIRSLPVEELYTQWGTSYDQGRVNNMQGLDDVELETLLPKYISLLLPQSKATSGSSQAASGPLRLVDFGCGTGRNTLKLITMLAAAGADAEIVGLDATPALLPLAEKRCNELAATLPANSQPKKLSFALYNPLKDIALPRFAENAQGLISTLVLEHLPLSEFFKLSAATVCPGGYLLITNTHSDFAKVAHGSIVNPETGEKYWSESHVHTIEDVWNEGDRWGFEMVEVQEGIPKDPNMVGAMRGYWEGVKCWVGFILRKKE